MKKIYNILITIAVVLFAFGQSARAANTWSVEYTGGKFKITRSGDLSITETVQYRTVSLSAAAGQHFTAIYGTKTFGPDDDVKEVTVSEGTPNVEAYSYQNGTTRKYRFEVLDQGGFRLAHCDRSITTGTNVPGSGLFSEKTGTIQSGEFEVTDKGYNQTGNPRTINRSSFYTDAEHNYLVNVINAQLRMTLEFEAKEESDGYQYLQVLANNTTGYDSGNDADKGDPGKPSLSRYMAGFEINTGSKYDTYKTYTFPVLSVDSDAGSANPWGYGSSFPLSMQKFKSGYRATDGKIILPTNLSSISVRFDASGSDNDDWWVRNLKAKVTAVDNNSPVVLAYSVAPGTHAKGNTVYVSVSFSEIVTGTSSKLTSNWGDLSYVEGSGTNVLTFSRTIPESAHNPLNITGCSGIADLASKSPSSVNITSLCELDADYAYDITYDLDGGTVATANPTSYTYTSNAITLNNPARVGYRFDGWTGSNGSTPQTSVSIPKHSHGNRSYTANWTQLWTGSGTQGSPYTITTTEGLDYLASFVNAGNTCASLYFQLGDDITYSATSLWNDKNSTEHNFTPISTAEIPFFGHFDGQNHTISGIRIYLPAANTIGLFDKLGIGGTITHVVLANTRITACNWVGGIAGLTYNYSSITYCTIGADVAIYAGDGDGICHGGITGDTEGIVQCCISSATITSINSSASKYGAIVGTLSSTGTVRSCIAKDAVVSTPVYSRGAIYGSKDYSSILINNYYRSCTVGGAQSQSDVFSITLQDNVSLPARTNPNILPGTDNVIYNNGARIDGVDYYKQGSTIRLNGTVPEGYTIDGYTVTKNGTEETVDVTENNGVYSFVMPESDVTVSANIIPIPWSGSGTQADPWIICYPSQMELLATNVNGGNSYSGKYFKLGNDITYSHGDGETENNYTPIGFYQNSKDNHPFQGNFDGDGHIISGIRIYSTDNYQGLFRYVTEAGTIHNVTLADAVINGSNDTGGIVGLFNAPQGLVCNCIVKSDVLIKASTSGADWHGGIVGRLYSGIVRACVSSAHLTPNGTGCSYYGGISGEFEGGNSIECCLVIDAEVSAYDSRGIITGYAGNNPSHLSQNYYFNCELGPASTNIGYGWSSQHTADITNRDGAVEAAAFTDKPGEIGVQTASYPGGITVYERGLYYDGVYYIAKSRSGTGIALTMVQGTKDGVTAWWGTFYDSILNYKLSEGAAAYGMDYNYDLIRVGENGLIIPKNYPVVIVSTVPEVYLTPAGSNTLDIATHTVDRILKGVSSETTLPVAAVLTVNGKGEVGFYRVENVTIPAHKAYLVVE